MNFEDAIEKLKTKDEKAFEYIYEKTKTSVYSIIIAITKDQNLTEDLMQDTYIKMIKSINTYNYKNKFTTWLLTIARNTAIDDYRRRKKEMSVDIHENEYLFPASRSDVDNEYNANYLLSFLDDEEREVIMLYSLDSLKHREIAEILNKPLGTITWIYNKAIKKMKEAGKEIKL
ncbi:RNA polymerase sigma factor [Haploplasma axanthum]|nr:RNA polymerase sigma factor [Haploplasma axanthum]